MVSSFFDKVKKLGKLDLVKVFSLTSISTFIKLLTGFVSVKVVSVLIGPPGIALVGQLNNFNSIIMSFASGGVNSGVTKYIASSQSKTNDSKKLIGTAVKITFFFSTVLSVFLIAFSKYLSKTILLDSKYAFVFIVFGITLILYSTNALLLSIVNGFKQYRLYVKISVASSITGLLISLFLVYFFGINGALLNVVTNQSFILLINIILLRKNKCSWLTRKYLFNKFDNSVAKKYFKYSLMTLVSALTVPISQLLLRSYLISRFSIQDAGCWEGMNRLSNMYLMIITSSFGVYYLPRLSELSVSKDIKHEIKTAYKVILPVLLVLLPSIYLSRNLIISILFSDQFTQMNQLFFWQLLGDFFKLTSWLIAYLMSAKAMMKLFISTEIIFSVLYVVLSISISSFIGFQGVVVGYFITYVLYMISMYYLVYRKI